MEVLNILNPKDKSDALELCKNLIEKNILIPVIGAGFSFDTQTDYKGCIPSAKKLQMELCNYIKKYSGYSQEEIDQIKASSLPDVADDFWAIYDRIPDEGIVTFFPMLKQIL